MRVKGGNDYIAYVKGILSGNIKENKTFSNYELKLMTDFKKFNELLYRKEEEVQLVRMIAGYAWVHSETAINEVGCIHSTQGYDLNYTFVIIGNEIGYDSDNKNIIVRPQNYYDQNGKKTAEYEALKEYIQHIYYVLMTRGIRGTYLYVCDKELREYISQYVETE